MCAVNTGPHFNAAKKKVVLAVRITNSPKRCSGIGCGSATLNRCNCIVLSHPNKTRLYFTL